MFKKFKTSKGLGIDNEVKISNIIQNKQLNGEIANSPSERTMCRHSNNIKFKEVITKKVSLRSKLRNKIAIRQNSEHSIRSALSYAIATLHAHFKVGKGMNRSQCNKLSPEA